MHKALSLFLRVSKVNGGIKCKGQIFETPTGAAKAIIGRGAVNGWNFWKYKAGKGKFVLLQKFRKIISVESIGRTYRSSRKAIEREKPPIFIVFSKLFPCLGTIWLHIGSFPVE